MSELIKYKNVQICQDEQIVLTDVNLTISSGEMVYLLGRVGSGKSSFMKTIYITGTTVIFTAEYTQKSL